MHYKNINLKDFFSISKNKLKLQDGTIIVFTDKERKEFLKWLGEEILYGEN